MFDGNFPMAGGNLQPHFRPAFSRLRFRVHAFASPQCGKSTTCVKFPFLILILIFILILSFTIPHSQGPAPRTSRPWPTGTFRHIPERLGAPVSDPAYLPFAKRP
jgi:hypothetical protein